MGLFLRLFVKFRRITESDAEKQRDKRKGEDECVGECFHRNYSGWLSELENVLIRHVQERGVWIRLQVS